MANKNRNVVIAYFDTKERANEAVEQLRSWDQANPDILLGGIGLMTWDGEKIITEKGGNRAAGTGAKAGALIGVAAAVLSGGIGLVVGSVVGATGGALLGALRKKGLHLTDEQLTEITDQIKGGKSAVVVMADDEEVNGTAAVLEAMGGTTQYVPVSGEVLDEMEKAAEIDQLGDI
jgi:uncharacterized membrane protein